MKNKLISTLLAITTITPMIELANVFVLPDVNPSARVEAAQLNVGAISPAPTFGVQSLYNVYLAHDNGRPIANTNVRLWFSGPNGFSANIGTFRTNHEGRVSVLATIPRNWRGISWVNLNAASTSAGVIQHWRIRR